MLLKVRAQEHFRALSTALYLLTEGIHMREMACHARKEGNVARDRRGKTAVTTKLGERQEA